MNFWFHASRGYPGKMNKYEVDTGLWSKLFSQLAEVGLLISLLGSWLFSTPPPFNESLFRRLSTGQQQKDTFLRSALWGWILAAVTSRVQCTAPLFCYTAACGPVSGRVAHVHRAVIVCITRIAYHHLCISQILPFNIGREYSDVSQRKHIHKPVAMWTTLNCLPNMISAWSLYSPEELGLNVTPTGKYSLQNASEDISHTCQLATIRLCHRNKMLRGTLMSFVLVVYLTTRLMSRQHGVGW
jgi:hypothetical protein